MLFKSALFLALPFASEAFWFWGSGSGSGSRAELEAVFEESDTGVSGTIELYQDDNENTKGTWKVTLTSVDVAKIKLNDDCSNFNGLFNWHVHDRAIGDNQGDCGKAVTGGHFDPTFACGGASQNQIPLVEGGVSACDALVPYRQNYDYKAICSQADQFACERGDQSGKMGEIDGENTGRRYWNTQVFEDNWLGDVNDIEGKSIVLHCCNDDDRGCAKRAACANLVAA
jgi:Cu/Zn superoxide dismutase